MVMQERRIIENKPSATLMIFLSVLILITCVQVVEITGRSIGHKLPTDSTLLPRPVTEHFVTVDGLRVHYQQKGRGEKTSSLAPWIDWLPIIEL